MSTGTQREQLRRAREHLEEWKYDARSRAYGELFEGEHAALSAEEMALLDSIDSALTRRTGNGLWDADEYGIVSGGREAPEVICIYHPEIPSEGYPAEGDLEEATRERLNEVLWEYSEYVATVIQEDLQAFLRERS